jgi:predicted transcriptional regulator of viral defense system
VSKARQPRTLLKLRDLEERGLSRMAVGRMVNRGELVRVHRGLYAEPDAGLSEHHDLAVVAARAPTAVVCLLSAAALHRLGTQAPHEVWIALPPRTWAPSIRKPPVRVVRFSGARYDDGIEEHVVEGVHVRVYSIGKTVVDLFRYRNKVGLDVALEALREARRNRRCSLAELTRLAQRGRVLGPMRPYLESLA